MTSNSAQRLFTVTASSLLDQYTNSTQSIVTFCESLDAAIGGGVPLGQMTEFVGPSGMGKTQLCLQLAVDARIPEPLGGVDGEVVYIDTECTFRIGRLEQIARFAIDHCTSMAESEAQRSALEDFTLEKILSGIYVQRCTDLNTFRRCVHLLQEFVSANKKVKLIVVDSIATHFREQFASAIERNHVVQSVILQLLSVALRFNTAVRNHWLSKFVSLVLQIFVTNQVTTKWTKYGESYIAPCLGPILTSNCSHQLFVYKKSGSTRYIRLIKSTAGMPCTILMDIGEAGVRDAQ
ncbi:DNA repair protein RAD51 3 [Trichuris trichiura]|uniref:DNA repair protein RAD51 homolog 3 n=1 Tax=Trichuris trichiura TaxID=36087 RepID=A0A077YZC7_TRITR|nr:DNA repair protein RAD51 3 [Trichuris trichiura]